MRKISLSILFMMCLLASRAARTEVTFVTKIETELRAGRIDHQTALLYKSYSLFDPAKLPPEYRERVELRKSGTPILVELKAGWDTLNESVRRELAPYLMRPKSDFSHLSPGGDFRIHYDLSEENGVDPTDADLNSIPDYIDHTAAVFDSCLAALLALGYPPPYSDGSQGGGEEYDVHVVDLSKRKVYGYTYSDEPIPDSFAYTSYIEIDNNYTDPIYQTTRGIDALRVTAAHEFFHAVQFSYYAKEDVRWWMEVSATWMEDIVYDYANDYYHYLTYFFDYPGTSLDTVNDKYEYGASIFAHFLSKRFGKDVIRSIWERIAQKGTAGFSVFDEVIPGGMAAAMAEFSLWNCFTGTRADTLRYYSEGTYYPEVTLKATHRWYPIQESGSTGHLAANYVRFIPGRSTGGLRIDPRGFKGNWSFQVACFPAEESPTTITDVPNWSRYNEIFLILTGTSFAGGPFAYSYWAQFDPDLTDGLPRAAALKQNWPNPFDLAKTAQTTIAFDLTSVADVTLSIYSVNGQLVRRKELGYLQPDSYDNFSWDGRDELGRPVASGIYLYQLKANNFVNTKKMLLIK